MPDKQKLYDFAMKWLQKFNDESINYLDLVDRFLADDCEKLGFKMDCGHAFEERFGKAAYDSGELAKVIDTVDDIPLLGSAIYSRWRYFNHWAYSGAEILAPENRAWFITALCRLIELSERLQLLQGGAKRIRIEVPPFFVPITMLVVTFP